jgi:hypothetical protein
MNGRETKDRPWWTSLSSEVRGPASRGLGGLGEPDEDLFVGFGPRLWHQSQPSSRVSDIHTIALGCVFLEPAHDTDEVALFSLRFVDAIPEVVDV